MTPASFETLAAIIRARSGGVLTPDQGYMLETRLGTLLKREGLRDLDALAARLRQPCSEALAQDMTELLTTNESSFFRDGRPFEHLRGSCRRCTRRARPASHCASGRPPARPGRRPIPSRS
jgi:chemotaxis protein methyltransferase CheR